MNEFEPTPLPTLPKIKHFFAKTDFGKDLLFEKREKAICDGNNIWSILYRYFNPKCYSDCPK